MHAASAVSGIRAARNRASAREAGVGSFPRSSEACTPGCISGVLTFGLMLAALIYTILSFNSARTEHVREYDDHVRLWTASERSRFASWHFHMSSHWTTDVEVNISQDLCSSEQKGFQIDDTENSRGVDDYVPLVQRATMNFPEYFEGMNATAVTELGALPAAVFVFTARSTSATEVQVGSLKLPLIYASTVMGHTPNPSSKCSAQQHGTWYAGRCHVERRLARICLQLEAAGSGWKLRQRTDGSVWGCDPRNHWNPATYEFVTQRSGYKHKVVVELRSSSDPLFSIAEITNGKFDFGMSAAHERLFALTFFGLGSLFCLCPTLDALAQRRRSSRRISEEKTTGVP
eukprot:TRINITY_DN108554_c0_g1_i1.p1 TRINITY_DN108554_c0_g1~~TRINITY_DN108554_c0_g1_i1.p1  ORF type:complete len:360 (-),score=49.91 TRINITY_DN108554_c0_g1_i1:155-1192(-)